LFPTSLSSRRCVSTEDGRGRIATQWGLRAIGGYVLLKSHAAAFAVIVSPSLVVRDGQHLHSGRVLLFEGVAQREGELIKLIAQRVGPVGVG